MKKKWSGFRIIVSMCAALGWWGLLYPELALTPDTVKITVENDESNLDALPLEWDYPSKLYLNLLDADEGQIIFRSKLLTNLSIFWETLHGGNDN